MNVLVYIYMYIFSNIKSIDKTFKNMFQIKVLYHNMLCTGVQNGDNTQYKILNEKCIICTVEKNK